MRTNQIRVIYRLDHALRLWEDYWYVMDAMVRTSALITGQRPSWSTVGAYSNFSKLRNHLLAVHRSEDVQPISAFLPSRAAPAEISKRSTISSLPQTLEHWTKSSRRVYGLNADLQGILRSTSLDKILWSDVVFPFPAFAVELAQPITVGGNELNFALISSMSNPFGVELLLFPASSRYKPMSREVREQLERLVQRKNFNRVSSAVMTEIDRHTKQFEWHGLWFDETMYESSVLQTAKQVFNLYTSHAEELPADVLQIEAWEQLIRIVVGFALYLKAVPPSTPALSELHIPMRSGNLGRQSFYEDEIFMVPCPYKLTRRDRVMMGIEPGEPGEYAQYELACHFREGYWRRRAGYGKDPTAPKVVHARPTIVRRDRLPPGGLPIGLTKEL